jgi:hypothetical protein
MLDSGSFLRQLPQCGKIGYWAVFNNPAGGGKYLFLTEPRESIIDVRGPLMAPKKLDSKKGKPQDFARAGGHGCGD